MADIRFTKTTDQLRLRSGPGTNYSTKSVIDKGQQIEYVPLTPLVNSGYHWVPVYIGTSWGWCATEFLEAFLAPKPVYKRTKWAGSHTIGSTSNNLRLMVIDCVQAGHPLASILSVLDAAIFEWIKFVSPQTVTIFRPLWPDNYPTVGGRIKFTQEWFDQNIRACGPYLKYIDYIQFINEKWPGNKVSGQVLEDIANFYIDLMNACNKIGVHCTVLDLAPGNMADDRHAGEPNQFAVMKPVLIKAAAEGHALNYHMYNDLEHGLDPASRADAYVTRWVHWLEQIPGLKFIGGEALVGQWGSFSLPSDSNQVIGMMRTIDGMIEAELAKGIIKREQILCYNPFTGNPGDTWKDFNMEPHYAAQTAYLKG